MNRVFITLSFLMGVVVLISNYLVQFPINYFGLSEILTYGAFSYPIAFLITDIANRFYGKIKARQIVYIGFIIGITFTIFFSTNYDVRGKNQRHIYTLFNWCKEKYNKKHIYFTRCFNRNEWCINWFIFWYYDLFSATRNWLCKNQFTKFNN